MRERKAKMGKEQLIMTDRKEVSEGSFGISYKEMRGIFEAKPREAAISIARKFLTITDNFAMKASIFKTPEEAAEEVFVPRFEVFKGQTGPKTGEFNSDEFKQRLNFITAASRLMTAKSNIPNLERELAGEFDEEINDLLVAAENPEELIDRREFNKIATVSSLGFATAMLAACSGPAVAATKIFASETPAATAQAPSPTPEPSKTPEPTAIPDPRFKELLPETLAKCMEQNVINWDTRSADLEILINKIKAKSVFSFKGGFFASDIMDNLPKEEKTNDFVDLYVYQPDSVLIAACAGIKHPSGKICPVFVLPIKRYPDEIIDYLAVAFGTPPDKPPESFYQDLKRVSLSSYSLALNMERDKETEKTENTKNCYDLIPSNKADAEVFRKSLKEYFIKDHTVFPEEKMNILRSFINGTIFTTSSIVYVNKF